jgi:hypothetical protein
MKQTPISPLARRARSGFESAARAARRCALSLLLVSQFAGLGSAAPAAAKAAAPARAAQGIGGGRQPVTALPPVNVAELEKQEALNPAAPQVPQVRAIHPPKGMPEEQPPVPASAGSLEQIAGAMSPRDVVPLVGPTGISPPASHSFRTDPFDVSSIPPDTMGAVSTAHAVTATNENLVIHTRGGVELSKVTLNAFWATSLLGGSPPSTFDPKLYFDRFNGRFIFVVTANSFSATSATLLAVSQTSDPAGTWNRFAVDAEAADANWADYPTVGFNKNWIVISVNLFTNAGGAFVRPDIYVVDKAAAYANTLSAVTVFTGGSGACAPTAHCAGTYVPAVVEDNTTENLYLAQQWNPTSGQIRVSKIAPTSATNITPVLSPGTQFPSSPFSWDSNAEILSGGRAGYLPQRQQEAVLPSGNRIMANDSRIQNAVQRNGSLWFVHHVMLSTVPLAAGTQVSAANPDNHTAVQWWQVNPSIENSLTTTPPLQRARIEDPLADNCHNGSGGLRTTDPNCDTDAEQKGTHYTFPSISVNAAGDVLIGYSRHSFNTYADAAYSFRAASDPPNTMRDSAIIRAGMGLYTISAGGQRRYGDYSQAMVDPVNDTDFWTVQEYVERAQTTPIGLTPPWGTWWAQIKPSTTSSTAGNLIISEFRLRGPGSPRDEFVELYNPSEESVTVNTADGSTGWMLAYSADGTTPVPLAVIPNGTTIPARGHYLVTNNTTNTGANGPYSLNAYPSVAVRASDGDASWSADIPDNSGLAVFRTALAANFNATTRMDSVGFTTQAPGLFKEGAGLPPLSTTAADYASEHTVFRSLATGRPRDTENNAADFVFANAAGTDLGMGARVGAPGPQNVHSPVQRNDRVKAGLIDPLVSFAAAPNTVRRQCADAGVEECVAGRSDAGTFSIRRRWTNNTGADVTTLRFRLVELTSGPAPAGTAILRPITSGQVTGVAVTAGGPVTIEGTTLQTPPAQAGGGGQNSSLAAGTVTLDAPLAPGASVNLQFLLGVVQPGAYRIFVNAEVQTSPTDAPLRPVKVLGKQSPKATAKPGRGR